MPLSFRQIEDKFRNTISKIQNTHKIYFPVIFKHTAHQINNKNDKINMIQHNE